MADPADETVAFVNGLNETLLDGLKRASEHITQLRRENSALKAQIAATPALLTDLQDRVTLLEQMVRPSHFDQRLHELRNGH